MPIELSVSRYGANMDHYGHFRKDRMELHVRLHEGTRGTMWDCVKVTPSIVL